MLKYSKITVWLSDLNDILTGATRFDLQGQTKKLDRVEQASYLLYPYTLHIILGMTGIILKVSK